MNFKESRTNISEKNRDSNKNGKKYYALNFKGGGEDNGDLKVWRWSGGDATGLVKWG